MCYPRQQYGLSVAACQPYTPYGWLSKNAEHNSSVLESKLASSGQFTFIQCTFMTTWHLQGTAVNIHTACFNIQELHFSHRLLCGFFKWFSWQWIVTISQNSITWLASVMRTRCVFSAVGTEFLKIIYSYFRLQSSSSVHFSSFLHTPRAQSIKRFLIHHLCNMWKKYMWIPIVVF